MSEQKNNINQLERNVYSNYDKSMIKRLMNNYQYDISLGITMMIHPEEHIEKYNGFITESGVVYDGLKSIKRGMKGYEKRYKDFEKLASLDGFFKYEFSKLRKNYLNGQKALRQYGGMLN